MLSRRNFVVGALALLAWPVRRARAAVLPDKTVAALKASPYVYISPLKSNGLESRCHAEVWYGWIDGSAMIITSKDGWKATALGKGLDRAYLWVGDFGKVKSFTNMTFKNQAFRAGPQWEGRAKRIQDKAILEKLMKMFGEKYPKEFPGWEAKMRKGFADGSRHLIAYHPAD
jgi:hypothetical protein